MRKGFIADRELDKGPSHGLSPFVLFDAFGVVGPIAQAGVVLTLAAGTIFYGQGSRRIHGGQFKVTTDMENVPTSMIRSGPIYFGARLMMRRSL